MKISRLEEIRQELGLNKSQFAQEMGLTLQYYSNIINEKGTSNLRLEHLEALLINRGVNPAWLMSGEGDKFLSVHNTSEWIAGTIIPDVPVTAVIDEELKIYLTKQVVRFSNLPIAESDLAFSIGLDMCKVYIHKNPNVTRDNADIPALTSAFLVLLQTAQSILSQTFELQGDTVEVRFGGRYYSFQRSGQPDK